MSSHVYAKIKYIWFNLTFTLLQSTYNGLLGRFVLMVQCWSILNLDLQI